MTRALAIAALLVGCSPTIPEGRFACTSDDQCPDGWSCSGGHCFQAPGTSDGGGPDAGAIVDGGPGADGGPDVDGGSSPDAGTEPDGGCLAGETYCATAMTCVDLMTSPVHCGTCGHDCEGSECVAGTCRPSVVRVQPIGADGRDIIHAAAVVADGIVIAGEFTGTVDFGGTSLTAAGETDAFAASYTHDGALRWVVRVGGSATDIAYDVAADPTGLRVVVVGTVDGAGIVETPSEMRMYRAAGMSADGFLLALDPLDGSIESILGVGGDGEDQVKGVAIDAEGNVWVAGRNDFPLTAGGVSFLNTGFYDGFIVRWDPPSELLSSYFRVATEGVDELEAIRVVAGSVCAAGTFGAALTLGGVSVPWAGGSDGIVVCLSSTTGAYQWNATMGSTGDDRIHDLDWRAGGSLAFAGVVGAETTFGSAVVTAPSGVWDIVVGTLTTAGTPGWVTVVSSPADFDIPLAVRVLSDGRIAASGFVQSAVTSPLTLPHAGANDAFLGVWSSLGTLDWARTFGGAENDTMRDVVELRGALYGVGELTGPVDFGTGTVPGGGDRDGYIMQILP